jgi:hypothetical protein
LLFPLSWLSALSDEVLELAEAALGVSALNKITAINNKRVTIPVDGLSANIIPPRVGLQPENLPLIVYINCFYKGWVVLHFPQQWSALTVY